MLVFISVHRKDEAPRRNANVGHGLVIDEQVDGLPTFQLAKARQVGQQLWQWLLT